MRLFCFLLLCIATVPAFGQTLTTVSVDRISSNMAEARILDLKQLLVSGMPQIKEKFCPHPEGTISHATGEKSCYTGSLSYNIVEGRTYGYTYGRTGQTNTANVKSTYDYFHMLAGSNKVLIAGHTCESGSHIRHYVKQNYRITGASQSYQLKVDLRVKLWQPTGYSALETNDVFKVELNLYASPYNQVIFTWDRAANRWKAFGWVGSQVDDTLQPSSDGWVYKTYTGYFNVSNNGMFFNKVALNDKTDWDTNYGIFLENDGPNDPDKKLRLRGYGWVDIRQITPL